MVPEDIDLEDSVTERDDGGALTPLRKSSKTSTFGVCTSVPNSTVSAR